MGVHIKRMDSVEADNAGVMRFAEAMLLKLSDKRDEGRCGWNFSSECSMMELRRMLAEHIEKGDMVDIANFSMMIWNRQNPTGRKP